MTTPTPITGFFIRVGDTYFNANQIWQVVSQGDGTARMYYTGGDYITLNMGEDGDAAITALNSALNPVDFTTNLPS